MDLTRKAQRWISVICCAVLFLSAVQVPAWRDAAAAQSPPGEGAGQNLAYIGSDGNIWLTATDGTGQRRLTDMSEDLMVFTPDWCPDGERIVYDVVNKTSGQSWCQMVDIHGTDLGRIPTGGGCDTPACHDGKIVFHGYRRPCSAPGAGSGQCGDIYVADLDTGQVTRLTDQHHNMFADWSPDGTQIAYWSYRGDETSGIYIMNADGSGERLAAPTEGATSHTSWSPTGNEIAFWVSVEGLLIAKLDEMELAQVPGLDWRSWDWARIGWSMDGTSIALSNSEGVWVKELDSGDTRKIANGSRPAWQPQPQAATSLSCGTWDGSVSDERIELTRISESAGDECRGAFTFSNETGIWDLGDYTLELEVRRTDNAHAAWVTLLAAAESIESTYLLPALDRELHTIPLDRYSAAQVSVSGEMSLASITVDLALYALGTAVDLIPGGSCLIPEEQLAYAAASSAYILAPAARLIWEGDLDGALEELQQLLPQFLEQCAGAAKEVVGDCVVEGLTQLLGKPIVIAKLAASCIIWAGKAIWDYFDYQGRPVQVSLSYEVSSLANSGPPVVHPGWTSYTNANYISDMAFDHNGYLWAVGSGGVVRWDTEEGTYTKYTTEHGLADNSVNAVRVNQDGILWFATDSGLSRFDGQSWTTYTVDDGLPENHVSSIALGLDEMWIACGESGVTHFDGATWTTYTEEDGLPDDRIRHVAVAPDGTAWFGSYDGVTRFDGATWTTYSFEDTFATSDVSALAVAPDGSLLVSLAVGYGGLGVAVFDGEAWSYYTADDGLPSDTVSSFAVAPNGALWVGAWGGISRFDGSAWVKYSTEDSEVDRYIEAVAVAPDGSVWVGTQEDGIAHFDGTTWKAYTTDDILADNSVQSVAVAPDGALWFGSMWHGATRFDGQTWTTYSPDLSLPAGERAIVVTHFDGRTKTVRTEENAYIGNNIIEIGADCNGDLWFGSAVYGQGLNRLHQGIWEWISFPPGASDTSHGIYAITLDSSCGLWMGGFRTGVFRYQNGTWNVFGEVDGLVDDWVDSIAVAPGDVIWVGTHEGVSRFDGNAWTTYTAQDGLPYDIVRALVVAPDGAVWAGTGDGIARFNGEAWSSFTVGASPRENSVFALTVTPRGILWAGTWAGIARFDGETWSTYTPADGLAHGEVSSLAITPDGAIWIATWGGVSRFMPRD